MGITKVNLTKYALGGLGMIPGTIVYVYFGTAISNISDAASGNFNGGGLQLGLLVGGSVLAILAVCYVSYVARKEVKKVLQKAKEEEEAQKLQKDALENQPPQMEDNHTDKINENKDDNIPSNQLSNQKDGSNNEQQLDVIEYKS